MDILKDYISSELVIKNSRFLNELFPCTEQNEARAIVKSQKLKYADATHVVHAFVLGLSGEVLGMSDDGEPSGTAGHPALDVLKGKNCTNLVLTITRWFGGTLLGTGGLVKAYGDCAKSVLQAATENNLLIPYVEKKEFAFSADYTLYQIIKRMIPNYNISDVAEEFSTDVNVSGLIYASEYEEFSARLKDLSNGRIIL